MSLAPWKVKSSGDAPHYQLGQKDKRQSVDVLQSRWISAEAVQEDAALEQEYGPAATVQGGAASQREHRLAIQGKHASR